MSKPEVLANPDEPDLRTMLNRAKAVANVLDDTQKELIAGTWAGNKLYEARCELQCVIEDLETMRDKPMEPSTVTWRQALIVGFVLFAIGLLFGAGAGGTIEEVWPGSPSQAQLDAVVIYKLPELREKIHGRQQKADEAVDKAIDKRLQDLRKLQTTQLEELFRYCHEHPSRELLTIAERIERTIPPQTGDHYHISDVTDQLEYRLALMMDNAIETNKRLKELEARVEP